MAKAETKQPESVKRITHPQRLYFRDGERIARDEAIIPMGHTHDQVLNDPNYFTHSMKRIRPNTIVRYIAEDYSFGGELLIPRVIDGMAKAISLTSWERANAAEVTEISDLYKVTTGATGFRVVLKATGAVVKDGLATKAEAYNHMAELETKARKAA
jgi:hypothetical protein